MAELAAQLHQAEFDRKVDEWGLALQREASSSVSELGNLVHAPASTQGFGATHTVHGQAFKGTNSSKRPTLGGHADRAKSAAVSRWLKEADFSHSANDDRPPDSGEGSNVLSTSTTHVGSAASRAPDESPGQQNTHPAQPPRLVQESQQESSGRVWGMGPRSRRSSATGHGVSQAAHDVGSGTGPVLACSIGFKGDLHSPGARLPTVLESPVRAEASGKSTHQSPRHPAEPQWGVPGARSLLAHSSPATSQGMRRGTSSGVLASTTGMGAGAGTSTGMAPGGVRKSTATGYAGDVPAGAVPHAQVQWALRQSTDGEVGGHRSSDVRGYEDPLRKQTSTGRLPEGDRAPMRSVSRAASSVNELQPHAQFDLPRVDRAVSSSFTEDSSGQEESVDSGAVGKGDEWAQARRVRVQVPQEASSGEQWVGRWGTKAELQAISRMPSLALSMHPNLHGVSPRSEYSAMTARRQSNMDLVTRHTHSRRQRLREWLSGLHPIKLMDALLPMFHPNSVQRRCWDLLIMSLVVFTAISVPLSVSFGMPEGVGMEVLAHAITVLFGLDLIANFRTAYYDFQGGLVRDSSAVAKHYMKMWFWIDLFGTIPFDAIVMWTGALSGAGDNSTTLAALGFLKAPRLLRLGRLLRFLEGFKHVKILKVVQLFMAMILISHWLACVWYMMYRFGGKDVAEDWTFTVELPSNLGGWPILVTVYSMNFYHSFLLMVGDNIEAYNNYERTFYCVTEVLGVFFYSAVVGQMATLVATMNVTINRHGQKSIMTQDTLRYMGLPDNKRAEVQQYFEFLQARSHPGSEGLAFLRELPISMYRELQLWAHLKGVEKVPLFAHLERGFMRALASRMQLLSLQPGESIFRVGDAGREMFFIRKGCIAVTSAHNEMFALLQPGEIFGELALLNTGKRTANCTALGFVDLAVLGQHDLQVVMADFPQSAALIRDRAAQRVQELAITRKLWFQDEDEQELDPVDEDGSSVPEEEPNGGDGEIQTCKCDGGDGGGGAGGQGASPAGTAGGIQGSGAADGGADRTDTGLACPDSDVLGGSGSNGVVAGRDNRSCAREGSVGGIRGDSSSSPRCGAGAGGGRQGSGGGGGGGAGATGSTSAMVGGSDVRVQPWERRQAGCAGRGDSVDEVRTASPVASGPAPSIQTGQGRAGSMAYQHDSGPAAQRPPPERPGSMQQPTQGAALPSTPGSSRQQSLDEQRPPSRVYWRSVDVPRPNDMLQLTPREGRDALAPAASQRPPAHTTHPPQRGTSGAEAPPSSQHAANAVPTAHREGSPGPGPVPTGPASDWPWARAGSHASSAANSGAPAGPTLSRMQGDEAPTGRSSPDSTRDRLSGVSTGSLGRPESRRDAYRKHWRSIDVARPTDVLQLTPRGGHEAGAAGPAGNATDVQPRPPSRQHQQQQQEQLQQLPKQQHHDAAVPPAAVFNSSLYAPGTAPAQATAAAAEGKASSSSFQLGRLQVRPSSSGNAGNPRRARSQQLTMPGPVSEATLDRASATGYAALCGAQEPGQTEAPYIPAGIAAAIAAAAAVPLGEALDRGAGEETDLDPLSSRQAQAVRSGNNSRNRTAHERRASSALYDQCLGTAASLPHPPTRTSTTGGMLLRATEPGLVLLPPQQHTRATATGSSMHGDHQQQHRPSATGYSRKASRRASVMISHWYMEQLERDAPLDDSGDLVGGAGGENAAGDEQEAPQQRSRARGMRRRSSLSTVSVATPAAQSLAHSRQATGAGMPLHHRHPLQLASPTAEDVAASLEAALAERKAGRGATWHGAANSAAAQPGQHQNNHQYSYASGAVAVGFLRVPRLMLPPSQHASPASPAAPAPGPAPAPQLRGSAGRHRPSSASSHAPYPTLATVTIHTYVPAKEGGAAVQLLADGGYYVSADMWSTVTKVLRSVQDVEQHVAQLDHQVALTDDDVARLEAMAAMANGSILAPGEHLPDSTGSIGTATSARPADPKRSFTEAGTSIARASGKSFSGLSLSLPQSPWHRSAEPASVSGGGGAGKAAASGARHGAAGSTKALWNSLLSSRRSKAGGDGQAVTGESVSHSGGSLSAPDGVARHGSATGKAGPYRNSVDVPSLSRGSMGSATGAALGPRPYSNDGRTGFMGVVQAAVARERAASNGKGAFATAASRFSMDQVLLQREELGGSSSRAGSPSVPGAGSSSGMAGADGATGGGRAASGTYGNTAWAEDGGVRSADGGSSGAAAPRPVLKGVLRNSSSRRV